MRRGDVVAVALSGDYGKPRPALVVQSDLFSEHPSVTILPITSELRDAPLFRLAVPADDMTGLRNPSQIMVDKAQTVPRAKLGQAIGRVDDSRMLAVTRALALFLGFA
jgi:mRNA interferase MazF